MYGLSRMALEDIISVEQVGLAMAVQRYQPIITVAAEDNNEELAKAIATVVRLRVVHFLKLLDEVALPWKVTVCPVCLQSNFNNTEAVYGRWWDQADKNHFAFLLHEVMTRAMEYNDAIAHEHNHDEEL